MAAWMLRHFEASISVKFCIAKLEIKKQHGGCFFIDDFMFGKVMENKEICKEVLELLLDIKIGDIRYPKLQEGHKNCIHAIFV